MMSLNVSTSLSGMLASQRRILLEKCDHMLSEGTGIVGDTDTVLFGSRDAFESFRGSYHSYSHCHGFQDFVLHSASQAKRRDRNCRMREIRTDVRNHAGHDHVNLFSQLSHLSRWIAANNIELSIGHFLKHRRENTMAKISDSIYIREIIHNPREDDGWLII